MISIDYTVKQRGSCLLCLNASYAMIACSLVSLLAIASPVHMTESGNGFSNLERQKFWFAKISCHTAAVTFCMLLKEKPFKDSFCPLRLKC